MKKLFFLIVLLSVTIFISSCEKTIDDEPNVQSTLQEKYPNWSNFASNETKNVYGTVVSHYRLKVIITGNTVNIIVTLPNQYDTVDGEDNITYSAEGINISGNIIRFTKCSNNGTRLNHDIEYEYSIGTNNIKTLKDKTYKFQTYNYIFIQKPIN